jgi:hypothetical protein
MRVGELALVERERVVRSFDREAIISDAGSGTAAIEVAQFLREQSRFLEEPGARRLRATARLDEARGVDQNLSRVLCAARATAGRGA